MNNIIMISNVHVNRARANINVVNDVNYRFKIMMIKIIGFSINLLCELNVEYIVEIYVTIKLIDDF
jgi:hypothetical protein